MGSGGLRLFAIMNNMQLTVALAFNRHFVQAGFQLAD